MTWGTGRRLPPDWPTIRERIKKRDGYRCTARLRNDTRCTETKRLEVDHVGDPDDHSDANLRTLCHWHHAQRTAQQASAARRPPSQKRPPEQHPGLRT